MKLSDIAGMPAYMTEHNGCGLRDIYEFANCCEINLPSGEKAGFITNGPWTNPFFLGSDCVLLTKGTDSASGNNYIVVAVRPRYLGTTESTVDPKLLCICQGPTGSAVWGCAYCDASANNIAYMREWLEEGHTERQIREIRIGDPSDSAINLFECDVDSVPKPTEKGVIIRGATMPKCCAECFCFDSGNLFDCMAGGKAIAGREYESRANNCPMEKLL